MRILSRIACGGLLIACSAAWSQVPASALMQPPPDAEAYTLLSVAGPHGSARHWRTPDGALMGRMSLTLRGQQWEQDEAVRLGSDGAIAEYQLRGSDPSGDVGETFAVVDSTARWQSPIDGGSARYAAPAFYLPAGWSIRAAYALVERLVATRTDVSMLPAGRARVEPLTQAIVGHGAATRPVQAWMVIGLGGTPMPIWTDARGSFFAEIGGISTVRAGYEDAMPTLRSLQDDALAAHAAALARQLGSASGETVVFDDVRAFVDGRRLYVEAGLTPAQALASATSVPARLLGVHRRVGSIVVGQDADLVLIDGDPSRRIGDLRHTRLVMMGGRLLDADRLRAAAGFGQRPSVAHAGDAVHVD